MRKEQKVVLGFVGAVVGLVGTLHIYLPFYSDLGQQAQTRAGMRNAADGGEGSRRTASMWKNMDQRKRQQQQQQQSQQQQSTDTQ